MQIERLQKEMQSDSGADDIEKLRESMRKEQEKELTNALKEQQERHEQEIKVLHARPRASFARGVCVCTCVWDVCFRRIRRVPGGTWLHVASARARVLMVTCTSLQGYVHKPARLRAQACKVTCTSLQGYVHKPTVNEALIGSTAIHHV